jgi:hypothetical protein
LAAIQDEVSAPKTKISAVKIHSSAELVAVCCTTRTEGELTTGTS